jgi:hypothetical protein
VADEAIIDETVSLLVVFRVFAIQVRVDEWSGHVDAAARFWIDPDVEVAVDDPPWCEVPVDFEQGVLGVQLEQQASLRAMVAQISTIGDSSSHSRN